MESTGRRRDTILFDGNILGVAPVPNRLVMFDGEIVHRAHHSGTDIGLRLQLSTHRINNRKAS